MMRPRIAFAQTLLQRPPGRAARWLAVLSLLCCSLAAGAQPSARHRIDFVYFGSPECSYCRGWEAVDLPKLKRYGSFRQVRFTKVTKAIGSPVPQASSFPEQVKYLREPIAAKLEGAGSPMFAILTDGKVVAAWRGTKKYSPEQILKIIRQQQAQSRTGPTLKLAVHTALEQGSRTAALVAH